MPPNRKYNNPRNQTSELFKRLTRMFSGPLVNYRQQNIRRYRRRDLDKFKFTSASGQEFKKSTYNPYSSIQSELMVNQDRSMRYVDFDQMEYTPEIASALDIYADEITTSSDIQPMMKIKCPNEEIKGVLHALYHNVLNLEYNLFSWSRTMCKYGDFFVYIDIDDSLGITKAIGLPSTEIERLEGQDESNPNYIQFQWNSGGITFENWQVAHFRVLGNDKYAPYGSSVLEPARRIWRQLTLLEDAMMAYRIVRSPERRVFYIDVGNIPPQDVEQFMQKAITSMKRNQVVDSSTGKVDLRYNPMSIEEDYFIPVRAGVSSRVESLPGGTYTGDIDDVKYLREKLFSALKIPQSYLAMGEGGQEDKTTLAQKDIRFARTIQRLQRVIIAELEKIGIIHLYTLGYRGQDLVSFKLSLNNPSKIAELQELEHWRTKFEVAGAATEGYFSRRWVAENVFGMTHEEFIRNQREMFYDRRFDAALEQEAEAVAAEAEGGLGGAEEDLGLGPEDEAGGEDDLDLGGDEAGGEDLGGDEEDTLLAEPAKRKDDIEGDIVKTRTGRKAYKPKGSNEHYTAGSKGKGYKPKVSPNYAGSARQRNVKGSYNRELATNTMRNTHKGLSDMFSLAKGIFEEQESTYNKLEEQKLFEVTKQVEDLIGQLELKDET